ncbi:hypothetical protein HY030_03435 [Candidatus Gottesmanbacteria bacterium]|nr:hypothetical protein [Candidatus Gottesmanbacteria bacterium]
MQEENQSYFLPAIGAIIFLIFMGAALMFFSQNKKPSQNKAVNTQLTAVNITTTVTPLIKTPEEKKTGEIFLTISEPVDKATVKSPTIIIKGKTVPNAEISINDQTLPANANGDFSAQVSVEEGDNFFSITANDQNGNSSEKEIMVTYEPESQ